MHLCQVAKYFPSANSRLPLIQLPAPKVSRSASLSEDPRTVIQKSPSSTLCPRLWEIYMTPACICPRCSPVYRPSKPTENLAVSSRRYHWGRCQSFLDAESSELVLPHYSMAKIRTALDAYTDFREQVSLMSGFKTVSMRGWAGRRKDIVWSPA